MPSSGNWRETLSKIYAEFAAQDYEFWRPLKTYYQMYKVQCQRSREDMNFRRTSSEASFFFTLHPFCKRSLIRVRVFRCEGDLLCFGRRYAHRVNGRRCAWQALRRLDCRTNGKRLEYRRQPRCKAVANRCRRSWGVILAIRTFFGADFIAPRASFTRRTRVSAGSLLRVFRNRSSASSPSGSLERRCTRFRVKSMSAQLTWVASSFRVPV